MTLRPLTVLMPFYTPFYTPLAAGFDLIGGQGLGESLSIARGFPSGEAIEPAHGCPPSKRLEQRKQPGPV